MLKYIRYTLAALCLAASVGCLALWWMGLKSQMGYYATTWNVVIDVNRGFVWWDVRSSPLTAETSWAFIPKMSEPSITPPSNGEPLFGHDGYGYHSPLWFPSLVSALLAVGVLRARRQFSILSALICVSVVAALLGVAVVTY
ncbi:hypothetical protein [Lacipirellula limnantheis]|uniref:Uncharacterized protein n=1 Tax=Lacipirellula limnantheis TaxID=2528024 RepID=A0A517U1K1_9BACT|nr:hypothetical protein [Lacipirellula limnantheis]QDT74478.1 hypothetical protein I41_36750 [Lacipirellula limnantheis]